MATEYKSFRYIFPPRPEYMINSKELYKYESTHAVQPKMNGACTVIFIKNNEIKIYGRHQNENLSNFKLKNEDLNILNCENDKWNVIVGEYMNKNQNGIDGTPWNHKFVIFDILVYNGEYLLGSTFDERVELLDNIFGKIDENEYLYKITDKIFRVKTFYDKFIERWDDIVKIGMLEGFVLKKKGAKLERGLSEKNNILWQLKSRKPTKNYNF